MWFHSSCFRRCFHFLFQICFTNSSRDVACRIKIVYLLKKWCSWCIFGNCIPFFLLTLFTNVCAKIGRTWLATSNSSLETFSWLSQHLNIIINSNKWMNFIMHDLQPFPTKISCVDIITRIIIWPIKHLSFHGPFSLYCCHCQHDHQANIKGEKAWGMSGSHCCCNITPIFFR